MKTKLLTARHSVSALKRCLAASAFAILLLVNSSAASKSKTAAADKLFAQWDRKGSPGAAIVVVKDGAIVCKRGYGYANLEHKVRITSRTRFDLASISKQFTGLSVAMLIEQGKLSPSDDVRKYLPDMPDFGKPITIAHLLNHTSGLRDWPESFLLSGIDFSAPITFEMILELARRQRELDFPTGERMQYSNTGYNLLAATVAKITGQSFREWTDANLFQPLGMKRTHLCDNFAEIAPDLASSYAPGDKPGTFRRVTSQLAAPGSSSLIASAEDMGRWLLNFEKTKVGGRGAIELMRQRGKRNDGATVGNGFGLFDNDYHGHKMFEHSGEWAGYRAFTMVIPEKRFAVAVLANAANMNTAEQARQIADIFLGKKSAAQSSPQPRPAVKGDPATWDAFLGAYRLGAGWVLAITREGDTLMTQATHEDKCPMTPIGANTFRVEGYNNQEVRFLRQESGAVTNLLYRGINAPKLDLPQVTPAVLDTYAGDYWSDELRVAARLEIHDGKLAIRHRSGEWLHFLPTGADRFDADFGGWAIDFARDESSEITEAKISGGRVRNVRYTRTTLPRSSPINADSQTPQSPTSPQSNGH